MQQLISSCDISLARRQNSPRDSLTTISEQRYRAEFNVRFARQSCGRDGDALGDIGALFGQFEPFGAAI
ncbi:hypothetical protein [Paraburkholderia sp. SIMBA_027]|uniref:hypothetical protein n=1 Tax=Paraburkholderia sp. SIMBA_027 TaxID=3085770 RepID=UPI00397B5328